MRDREQWAGWSTESLRDYENQLYDQEVAGDDTWALREEVLAELSERESESR
jgi:hypothetical protein